jgi:uncharacterized membrane protein
LFAAPWALALPRWWAIGSTVAATSVWAATFSWLAVVRHLAGGSNAEDLGFTDQVLWNFLQGRWFHTSVYVGATWNTELDVGRMPRPDSLLAFHAEPMLVLLVPLYLLGGGAVALLLVQAMAVAAGAIPAYRLGYHLSGARGGGIAVSVAYLLSPLGQWAVLSDFHTSTLAGPLLVLAVERLVVGGSPAQALLAGVLAASTREDVGLVVAVLGVTLVISRRYRRTGVTLVLLGLASTILSVAVIRSYSGELSPLGVRYGATVGSGLGPILWAVTRPAVLEYAATLVLSGGWLGLLSPLALLPMLPPLGLNVLSSSPWMAAGKAHYSALVLPFIAVGAAAGFRCLRGRPRVRSLAAATLIATSIFGYLLEGAGPLAANYAPALLTEHAATAATMAATLPADAAITATSALVPRVSGRTRVYVFPAMEDAEYAFLDLKASPAPTSAGDVYLRVQNLLANGWRLNTSVDGLLLLVRSSSEVNSATVTASPAASGEQHPRLVAAALVPSPDGAIDVDGPRWILHTTWQTDRPLPPGTRLEFTVDLTDGEQLHLWDIADLWWNPPERWTPGEAVTVDVRNVPVRRFKSWQAMWNAV